MKKVYCIEFWYDDQFESFRDGSFWGCIKTPWKFGLTDIIEEYDTEDEFKDRILEIINNCGVIGKAFIKEI